jgi:hypothetical protein
MMNSPYSTSVEAEKENPRTKKSKGTEKRKDRSRVNTQDDNDAMGRLAVTMQPFIPRLMILPAGRVTW